jgi:hypothetical protein
LTKPSTLTGEREHIHDRAKRIVDDGAELLEHPSSEELEQHKHAEIREGAELYNRSIGLIEPPEKLDCLKHIGTRQEAHFHKRFVRLLGLEELGWIRHIEIRYGIQVVNVAGRFLRTTLGYWRARLAWP